MILVRQFFRKSETWQYIRTFIIYRSCSNAILRSNKTALQQLKDIHRNAFSDTNHKYNLQHVRNAIDIYESIEGNKDYLVIDSFVSLCLHFRCPDEILIAWNDIKHEFENISVVELIRCFMNSKNRGLTTGHFVQLLHWIKSTNYKFATNREARTYSICLSKWIGKCRNMGDIEHIHSLILNNLPDTSNKYIKTALIIAYAKHHNISNAESIFSSMEYEDRDVVVIGAMMKAHLNAGNYSKVLLLYNKYASRKDDVLHLIAMQACIHSDAYYEGKRIYENIIKKQQRDFSSLNIKLQGAFIDFYARFGYISEAKTLFNCVHHNDMNTVILNVMMKALVNNKRSEEALNLFDTYSNNHQFVNDMTYIFAVKACITLNDFKKGQEIIKNINHIHLTVELKTTLISFFAHFKDIKRAKILFDSIKDKDKTIVTLTEMMHAYCSLEMYQECIDIFDNIKNINSTLVPDVKCYANIIYAHTENTSYHLGVQIHRELKEKKNLHILNDSIIQSTLINFYGKCGKMKECEDLIAEIAGNNKDTAICNAMINAFGRNGNANMSKQIFFEYFKSDKYKKCVPDRNTFIYLMNAFNHCGDKESAIHFWRNEINDVNIKYYSHLVTTVVDCLSRRGDLNEAYDLIQEYEKDKLCHHPNDKNMWLSLLNGCKKYENNELAQLIYDKMSLNELAR